MSLVNVIIILLQQCPLGGFQLGRFADELDAEVQSECTLPVFEPGQEYGFEYGIWIQMFVFEPGQHWAETEDGEMKACAPYNLSPFELFSFPVCINFKNETSI